MGHAIVRLIVWMEVTKIFFRGRIVLNFEVGPSDLGERNPVIVALIEVLKMDVVAVGILISGFGGIIIYN